ncbi:MAG: hypothetical protein WD342_20325 [Verrucomicrobiales bacterium]
MKILLTALTLLTAINTAGVLYLVLRDDQRKLVRAPLPVSGAQTPETSAALPSYGQVEDGGSSVPFHERSVGEKISQASVIFTIRYEAKGGQMIGVVDRILKKADGTEFYYYDEGDHYAGAEFTPKEGESRGEGMVNFCLGSPALMSCGSSIHNGRVPGLGGINLEDFEALVENTK